MGSCRWMSAKRCHVPRIDKQFCIWQRGKSERQRHHQFAIYQRELQEGEGETLGRQAEKCTESESERERERERGSVVEEDRARVVWHLIFAKRCAVVSRDKLIANPATTITCRLAACQLQVWQLQVCN